GTYADGRVCDSAPRNDQMSQADLLPPTAPPASGTKKRGSTAPVLQALTGGRTRYSAAVRRLFAQSSARREMPCPQPNGHEALELHASWRSVGAQAPTNRLRVAANSP